MVKTLPLASGIMTPDSSVSAVSAASTGALEVTREDFFSTLRWQERDCGGDPQQENDRAGKSCVSSPLRGGAKSRAAGLSGLFRKSNHHHRYRQHGHPQQRSWGRRQRSSSRQRRRVDHDDCRSVVSNYEYGDSMSAPASDKPSSSSSVVLLSCHSSSSHRTEHPQQRGDVSSSASSVVSCNVTIASHDTVKASNRSGWPFGAPSSRPDSGSTGLPSSLPPSLSSPAKMLRRWGKLRGLLGSSAAARDGSAAEKLYSLSEEGPRVRCCSEDGEFRGKGRGSPTNAATVGGSMAARARSTPTLTRDEKTKLDQSILGRLDGLAVLSLGPAHRSTLDAEPDTDSQSTVLPSEGDGPPTRSFPACRPETLLPFERFPPFAFTGCSLYLAPRDMIRRMLWNSGEHPELVLEGLVPGEDRWSVRIEQISSADCVGCPESQQGSPTVATSSRRIIPHLRSIPIDPSLLSFEAFSPSISPASAGSQSESDSGVTGDGGSPGLPAYHLWPKLWGTQDPAPDRAEVERMVEEDPLLHLAAEHSIPIDLDEQTFCVSDRAHLDVIHNFISASLSVGRLDTAIVILTKLLKGLDPTHDTSMLFVRGAALQNVGVLLMWQAKYSDALDRFHLAVEERTATLPRDHPDVRVSLVWKGLAQFAHSQFDDALFSHELALEMTPPGDMTRSKILCNMGVVLYQKKQYMLALQKFTLALEIQRGWLQGPVRRDSLVHEASLTLMNMGKLYMERGDFDRSYFVYEEALLLQTTIFRKDHDLVLESLMSLALTRARDGKPDKALQILQGCLRSQTARYGKDSFQTMDCLGFISYLHEHLECPEDALKCLAAVKKWQKLNLPPGHPSLRKTRETVKRLEEAVGKNLSVWI